MEKKYITDIAGNELIEDFTRLKHEKDTNNYDMPFVLQAPTGFGKSSFIKGRFYNFCKDNGYKVLMLLPRSMPTEQFINEIDNSNKADVITVSTYQAITYQYINAGKCNLDYDFIVCDECHFFVTDSLINSDVDICFDLIRKSRAYKIFISATPEPMRIIIEHFYNFFKTSAIIAENTVIKKINTFSAYKAKDTKQTVIDIMASVPNKAVVFSESAQMANDIYCDEAFKQDSLFICSKYNNNYAHNMDIAKRDKMISRNKFECKYLICTKALDVGFNLEDANIKDIICTFTPENWTAIIQALGRKRQIDEDTDKVILHIKDFTKSQIEKMLQKNEEQFEHYNYYKRYGKSAYMKIYRKEHDPSKIMYFEDDGEQIQLKVDVFIFAYYKYQQQILEEILQRESYAEYLKEKLNCKNVPIYRKKKEDYGIYSRLEKLEGQTFNAANKSELIQALNIRNGKKIMKDMHMIDKYLRKLETPYCIDFGKDANRHITYTVMKLKNRHML